MSKIELFENERASGYNQFVFEKPGYPVIVFLDRLPNLLSETEQKDLLVVGCGTGNEIERFVQTTEHWKITGIDPSPQMITQAKERFQDFENVELMTGLLS